MPNERNCQAEASQASVTLGSWKYVDYVYRFWKNVQNLSNIYLYRIKNNKTSPTRTFSVTLYIKMEILPRLLMFGTDVYRKITYLVFRK